jgi:hypothetical protein
MKAVGASAGFLYRIVFSQSAILTAAGFARVWPALCW